MSEKALCFCALIASLILGAFFAAGAVMMVLALVQRSRRRRHLFGMRPEPRQWWGKE
jgi:uncharacterized protein (DUF2062 family)